MSMNNVNSNMSIHPMTITVDPATAAVVSDDDSEGSEMFALQKRFKASHIQDSLNVKRDRFTNVPCPRTMKFEKRCVPAGEETDSSLSTKSGREVRFDTITVRNYYMDLGDNPACSIGPPVTLSWEYEECDPEDLDVFEMRKRPRRVRELILNYYRRRDILMNAGYSERDLKHAGRVLSRSQRKRETTKFFMPVARMEEAVRGASRRARQVAKNGVLMSI